MRVRQTLVEKLYDDPLEQMRLVTEEHRKLLNELIVLETPPALPGFVLTAINKEEDGAVKLSVTFWSYDEHPVVSRYLSPGGV